MIHVTVMRVCACHGQPRKDPEQQPQTKGQRTRSEGHETPRKPQRDRERIKGQDVSGGPKPACPQAPQLRAPRTSLPLAQDVKEFTARVYISALGAKLHGGRVTSTISDEHILCLDSINTEIDV